MTERRQFRTNIIPDDILKRMQKANNDAKELAIRRLLCPYCGYITAEVFADTGGHIKIKCQKCKAMMVYNLTPGTLLCFRIARH